MKIKTLLSWLVVVSTLHTYSAGSDSDVCKNVQPSDDDPTCSYRFYSLENIYRTGKPNQDRACSALYKDIRVVGIFDGHGPDGHTIATQAIAALGKHISAADFEVSPAAIKTLFTRMNQSLDQKLADRSGTTAVLAFLTKNKTTGQGEVVFAHAGDSRAVLIRDGRVVYETEDHKPLKEKEMLEARGGRVFQVNAEKRPDLWYVDCNGLISCAFSRALGNGISGGVIQPDSTVSKPIAVNEGDVLVLASDGLWDKKSSQKVAEEVAQKTSKVKGISGVSKYVAEEARKAGSRDDISCLVAQIK